VKGGGFSKYGKKKTFVYVKCGEFLDIFSRTALLHRVGFVYIGFTRMSLNERMMT
jgi:hypothetical protein